MSDKAPVTHTETLRSSSDCVLVQIATKSRGSRLSCYRFGILMNSIFLCRYSTRHQPISTEAPVFISLSFCFLFSLNEEMPPGDPP